MKEAIVLAGGLGTRLRSAVPDLPKCMAPVAGHPFLKYLIDYYLQKGINRFIFSLGYMHEVIEKYLNEYYPSLNYTSVIESEPLGTGGGIKLACRKAISEQVLILNGDTFFGVDLTEIYQFHAISNADCTLALKPMLNFDRYGVVEMNQAGRIGLFHEKKQTAAGNINGGVYLLKKSALLESDLPDKFSFEKDFMETHLNSLRIYGIIQEGYFIDIGIPVDYERSQTELPLI